MHTLAGRRSPVNFEASYFNLFIFFLRAFSRKISKTQQMFSKDLNLDKSNVCMCANTRDAHVELQWGHTLYMQGRAHIHTLAVPGGISVIDTHYRHS